jgi:hypothetical protein
MEAHDDPNARADEREARRPQGGDDEDGGALEDASMRSGVYLG